MPVTQTNHSPSPGSYDAYVYKYTNLKNNKKYIGMHTGSVDDYYTHSSTCEVFHEDLVTDDFLYEALDYGTTTEMKQLENVMLVSVNASKNPEYYNKQNGYKQYSAPRLDKCRAFVKSLVDNDLYPITQEKIKDHVEMEALQVRFQHDPEHQRIIKERIIDAKGSTKGCNPILVWEGRGTNGDDVRGDGNHTLWGASAANATIIPVKRVAFEDNCDLSFEELRLIGNLLNKRPDILKKTVSKSDGIKHVLDMHAQGVPYGAPENIAALKEMGFTGGKSRGEIKTILDKAKKKIDLDQGAEAGLNYIDYTSESHKHILKNSVDQFQGAEKVCSIAMSSGRTSIERILEALDAGLVTGNNICMVVVHHPSPEQGKKWRKEILPKWERIISNFITNCQIRFTELAEWETDTTKVAA